MALVKEYTDIEFLSDLKDIVADNPNASQREIGSSVGVSVALVNGFIKRCLARGWIATTNLNLNKLRYMITAEGMAELTKRSLSFMKRNFQELSNYKKNIDAHIAQAVQEGKSKVVLYGASKVDFLIEESCRYYGINFERKNGTVIPDKDAVANDELAVIGESTLDYSVDYNGLQTVYALAR